MTGNSGIGNSSLTYDGLGNIKAYSSKGRSLVYNYNTTDNRLTSVSGIAGKYGAFAYDDRGNIYGNGGKTFTYNRANQLTASGTNSYTYDGHNRRVKQTDSKGTSYSLYSQDGTLYYRETPTGGINYIYLGNKLIAKDGYIPENGGKQHYRPFGESIEGAKDDVGYTGHKFDTDLGLSYMQARYYDPIIGRIYSNDPVGYTPQNPVMSFNRYLYVNNNPYKYKDPDGKFLFLLAAPAVYTGAMALFDITFVGAVAWGVSNSSTDDDSCDAGTFGCSGNNKGKKGKEFRGGKKKNRDQWGKYSGKKHKDFRKWWEKEKQKDGSLHDLETEEDRDDAYEDYEADQKEREEQEEQEEQEEREEREDGKGDN